LTSLPERVDLPTPPLKLAVLLLVCLLFVAGGVWMLSESEPFGWLAIGFFGLGVPVFALMMVAGVGLSLDREGFTIRTALRSKRYAWKQVSAFTTVRMRSTSFIVFDDLARPAGWLSQANRAITGGNSSIPASIISGSVDDACALLNAFRARTAGA
jgi:hypothetical protein